MDQEKLRQLLLEDPDFKDIHTDLVNNTHQALLFVTPDYAGSHLISKGDTIEDFIDCIINVFNNYHAFDYLSSNEKDLAYTIKKLFFYDDILILFLKSLWNKFFKLNYNTTIQLFKHRWLDVADNATLYPTILELDDDPSVSVFVKINDIPCIIRILCNRSDMSVFVIQIYNKNTKTDHKKEFFVDNFTYRDFVDYILANYTK